MIGPPLKPVERSVAPKKPLDHAASSLSLREMAARGFLIVASLKVVGVVVGRVSMLILPFFLLPSDFGIFALAMFFFGLLNLAADLGISAELIRRRDSFEEAAETAFVLRIVLAAVLLATSGLVGYAASSVFMEPRLTLPIVVLSIGLVFQALSMVPRIIATRALDFARAAIPDHVGKFSGPMVTVGLAVVGFAYWSPVYGTLFGLGLGAALQLLSSRWRPRFRYQSSLARQVVRFGQFVMLTSFANSIAHSIDNAIVGLLMGVTSLGFYSFAYSWGVYFISNLSAVFGAVSYPVLSQAADSPARVKRIFLENLRYYGYAAICLTSGLVALSPVLVATLYGGLWLPAVVPIQILAFVGLLLGFAGISGDTLVALGKPRAVFALSAAEACLLVVILPAATWLGGLPGTSLAALAGAGFLAASLGHSVCRMLGVTIEELLRAITIPSVAGLVSGIAAIGFVHLLSPSFAVLATAIFLFAAAYAGLMQAFTRGRFLKEVRWMVDVAVR